VSKILAGVAVVGVLGFLLFHAARRERRVPPPESAIFNMVTSARGGDLRAYLDCFSGEIKRKLSAQAEGEGPEKFADYLGRSVEDLAGVYVGGGTPGEYAEVELEAEFVFPSRTERQRFRLVKEGREWRISDVRSAEYTKPVEKYGSRVYSLFPDGGEQGER